MSEFIWRPESCDWTAKSNVAQFMAKHNIHDYHELREKSVEDIDWFWDAAMTDMGVEWFKPYSKVSDKSGGFPWTKWFIDGELNLVFNVLNRHAEDEVRGKWTALVYIPESGEKRHISYRELAEMTNRCANAMKAAGIGRGDFVGLYAPMWPEMVAAFYATIKIGARIVPVFCGFGERALEERLEASKCKMLFAAKTLQRRGKAIDTGAIAQSVAERVECVERCVFLDTESWSEFISGQEAHCRAEVLPAEEPCLVIYTSGTTGRPKGTVHTHSGCLAQMGKELRYAFDVKPQDQFFWFTDIGWMMGPWELIGCHLYGASDETSYDWFFDKVGQKRCPVINISGGTEIVGCHLSPLPVEPIKACSLGGPGLGMDVDVFNDDGLSVRNEVGHLVCRQPAPSMTKSFLNDDDRYLETYFSRFGDAVWYHGDWASVDPDGKWFLHGRSDDTVKVAGKRIGPAEVESVLMRAEGVSEAASIGVPHELKGQTLVCFVVMKNGATFEEGRLLDHVASELGKPLKPQNIHQVAALPKTRSGKIIRGTIMRVYLGEDRGDVSSVQNPEALDEIAGHRP